MTTKWNIINKKKLSNNKTSVKDKMLLSTRCLSKKHALCTMPHKLDEKKLGPLPDEL